MAYAVKAPPIASTLVSGTRYEKQVAFAAGEITYPGGKTTIDAARLKLWCDTANKRLAAGREIPIPIGHTESPEATRGKVRQFTFRKDSKGRDAAFMELDFQSPEVASYAVQSDVSVFCDSVTEADGTVYDDTPIHVALTSYPVLTGLDKFAPLALSLTLAMPDDNAMDDMKKLLEALGVTVPDGELTLEIVTKAIQDYMAEQVDKASQGGKADKPSPAALSLLTTAANAVIGSLNLSPAGRDKLRAAVIPKSGAVALSTAGMPVVSLDVLAGVLANETPIHATGGVKIPTGGTNGECSLVTACRS